MRIYFDKQIFSHLFKQEKQDYIELLTKLYSFKVNTLYCYSHAHLLDLKNDKTEIKYKELDFIETLVNDNYLSYNGVEKITSCYLVKPKEAFADVNVEDDSIDFTKIFDFDTSALDPTQREQLEVAKNVIINMKFDPRMFNQTELSEDIAGLLSKFLPTTAEPMSIIDMSQHLMDILHSMENDKSVYKGLRNISDKYLNNGKFTVDYNNIDFNEDLKNSPIQKTFIEYVTNNLNPNGDKQITNYDFFTNAYFTLDLLGIITDSSKTVKFNNMLNDGFHSYYAAYCDILVSDDLAFLKKTKTLYKLLDIETQVFHIDEFMKAFIFLIDNRETSKDVFFSLLTNDLRNGLITKTKKSLRSKRETTTIKSQHNYLGHFNRIDNTVIDGKSYAYLHREIKNYSSFSFLREHQLVINNAVRLFGSDKNFKGDFKWDEEIEEIKTGNWKGRYWDFNSFTILIEIKQGTDELGLLLSVQ